MRNPFARDLILLHPPALYDFRTRPTFLGPVADAVPSTAMFEMYPVGLTSIAEFLERNDIRMGGMPSAKQLLARLRELRPRNELVFELFHPAGDDFFARLAESVPPGASS